MQRTTKTIPGVHLDDARNAVYRVTKLGWTARQAGKFAGISTRKINLILKANGL